MKYGVIFLSGFLTASGLFAAVKTEQISYKHGNVVLHGFLAYDDAVTERRPGVIVVHEWWGLNDHARESAKALAELGYVGFAIDMYGGGKNAGDQKEAAALSGIYKNDRALMRGRANAGLRTLKQNPRVDGSKIAAIGYCFGGTVVLEMARAGLDVDGVVSFHGGLGTPEPSDAKNIKGRVLALCGADDPYVSDEENANFEEEMRKAKVDWQRNIYGGAVHGFTNPANGTNNSKGAAYNEKAAERSWEAMKLFLGDLF